MLIRRLTLVIGLLAQVAVFSQPGQDSKSKQGPSNTAIQIRAVVTDRAGRFVEGLTKEDFLLTEDDALQPVHSFSVENLDAKPVPTLRTIILLVDTAHIQSGSLEKARIVLRCFVIEQKSDRDLMAVMTTAGKPGTAGEFTSDGTRLKAQLDQVRPGYAQFESFLTPVLCGRVVKRDPQAISLASLVMSSEDRTAGSMQAPGGNSAAEAVSKCMMVLLEASARRRRVMTSIGTAVERISAMPGQHIIALFTEGFSMTGASGEIAINEVRPAISSAVRSGVMIYTFDVKVPLSSKQPNIESYSLAGEILNSALDMQHVASLLADQTGGDAFHNLDSLSEQLREMLDENRFCYRLMYDPPRASDPRKYRTIGLSIKGHPEYRIRTQKGYDMTDPRWAR